VSAVQTEWRRRVRDEDYFSGSLSSVAHNAYLFIHFLGNRVSSHLTDMLLHAQPLFVAHRDAAVAPLVVHGPLFGVAEGLLGLLQVNFVSKVNISSNFNTVRVAAEIEESYSLCPVNRRLANAVLK